MTKSTTRGPDGTLFWPKVRRPSGFLWIVRSLLFVSSGALRARARASRAMKMLKLSRSAEARSFLFFLGSLRVPKATVVPSIASSQAKQL